jgi:hypothetical protein
MAEDGDVPSRKWRDTKGLSEQKLDQLSRLGMRGLDQDFIDHVAPHQSIGNCDPTSEFWPEFLPSAAWDAWQVGPEDLQRPSQLQKTDPGTMFHPRVPWELGLQAYCEVIFNIDEDGVPIGQDMAARCTLAPHIGEALRGVQSMRFEAASPGNADLPRQRIVQPIEFCAPGAAFF